jgi:hypothetical protein
VEGLRSRLHLAAGASILLLFWLMAGAQANQSGPTGNVAGHWPFDSAVTPSPDVSGNGHNATLAHTPSSVAGLFGNALNFAAASVQYASVPEAASLDIGTGSFSVGVWIKPSGTTNMRVMNKWDGSKGWLLDINAGPGGTSVPGNVRLRAKDANGVDSDCCAAGTIGTGAWKHIAGVYDRTAHTAKLYVNGVQVGATKNIATLTGSLNNTTPLQIATLGTTTPYFNGVMDEPIYYTRALSLAEIQNLAQIPLSLTASTNQINQVTLNWTAATGAQNYSILRGTQSGGPYSLVKNVIAGTTSYVDAGLAAGTYYYVIQSNLTGAGGYSSAYSNQAQGISLPPPVAVYPPSVTTSESGGNATLALTVNNAPSGAASITLTSSNATLAKLGIGNQVPAASVTVDMTGATVGQVFQVTVYGQDDHIFQPTNQTYVITFTVSGGGTPWSGLAIPAVDGTNIETDVATFIANPSSGLMTDTAGGQATFNVTLSSIPASGLVLVSVTSSNTSEGTVSPTTLTFTNLTWQTPQPVTVTGQGVNITYLDTPYTVFLTGAAGSDSQYLGTSVAVSVLNRHLEVPPALPRVWGSTGGGCGLLGLEILLPLLLLRRRRTAKAGLVPAH